MAVSYKSDFIPRYNTLHLIINHLSNWYYTKHPENLWKIILLVKLGLNFIPSWRNNSPYSAHEGTNRPELLTTRWQGACASQQLPHAQKGASLPAAPWAGQGSADRTGRIHKVKWKNLSFASITFLVARRYRLVLALFSPVVETKGQLLNLPQTILHIYINRLAVSWERGVV